MGNALHKHTAKEWLISVLLAASGTVFSVLQITPVYKEKVIMLTVAGAFFVWLLFFQEVFAENGRFFKAHPTATCLLLLASCIIALEFYQGKCIPLTNEIIAPLPFRIFRPGYCIAFIPALFHLLVWICRNACAWLAAFWQELDSVDRKIYRAASVALAVLLVGLYLASSQWYLQFDNIFSLDSGWCYLNIFPDVSYYDIRHPALSVITFPIWAIVHFLGQMLFPSPLTDGLCAVCLQFLNVQALLLMGMMVGKLAHSRWVTILYYVSAPVLLFTVFFEKYQICTFFVIAYVYQLCRARSRETSLIVAAGSMPPSVFIMLGEFLSGETWKEKSKRLLHLLAAGIAFMVCFGRAGMLDIPELIDSVSNMTHLFGLQVYPRHSYLFSFINLAQGTVLFLPSGGDGSRYMWNGVTEGISVAGPIILGVVLIGFWKDRKSLFTKVCAIWIVVAALLFMVIHWSVDESPLFSLCFSWAFLPLFCKGLRTICARLHWKETYVILFFTASVLTINLASMIYISMLIT